MQTIRWVLAAAISALACQLAVVHATPIDAALPILAVLVTILAAISYPSVMLAVPLLILAEIAIVEEPTRFLAFGAVVAVGGGVASLRTAHRFSPPIVAIVSIAVLRWIPLGSVLWGRELFLLAIAAAIVFVLGRTPFAIAVAVIAALVTPAIPLRTLALPLIVLFIAVAARTFGMPRLELRWPSSVMLAFSMLFFAWSGIVARAFPYFLKPASMPKQRVTVAQALGPRRSVILDVPEGARSVIVSGANVAHLRRGALLGRMEPGSIEIRIGDGADWGYMRREQYYGSRNPLPHDPAGRIRQFGYTAWVDGAGRIALPRGARRIQVIADAALPRNASLQVEGFE